MSVNFSGCAASGTSSVTPTVTAVDGHCPNCPGIVAGSCFTSSTSTFVTLPPNRSRLSHST